MGSARLLDLQKLVDASLVARRALWRMLCAGPGADAGPDGRVRLSEDQSRLWAQHLAAPLDVAVLRERGRVDDRQARWEVDARLLETHRLLAPFLEKLIPSEVRGLPSLKMQADAAFLVWRNIKRECPAADDPLVYQVFPRICKALREYAGEVSAAPYLFPPGLRARVAAATSEFCREMPVDRQPLEAEQYTKLFFEVCLSLEEPDRGAWSGESRFRTEWLDADFLLSRLYGMRTGIPGFDLLFDGGISLADPLANPLSSARIILVRGSFNAGKSILGLTLAAEVMRKGGSATLVALDDSLDALIGYLGSFALSDETPAIREPSPALRPPASERPPDNAPGEGGMQVIFSPFARETWDALLRRIERHFDEEAAADLRNGDARPRLLVIDPVNSVIKVPRQLAQMRADLTGMLERVRQSAGNVVFVAESEGPQSGRSGAWTEVLPYLADVVIDLSTEHAHGYSGRTIQVSKSRFQRERRGRHPFSILPGQGITISPSSLAYGSDLARALGPTSQGTRLGDGLPIVFGLPDLDRLLGAETLAQGDTIALRGPQGSYKTLIALHFLLAERPGPGGSAVPRKSLLLTDRRYVPLLSYVKAYDLALPVGLEDKITLAPLSTGYVRPGQLLREIEDHFREASEQGFVYDRVLLANVGRWDSMCPFLAEDLAFGGALMDLFRREGASVAIVCDERQAERRSHLQRTVSERCTVLLDFQRIEFKGAERRLMRVVRCPSAPASWDWQELMFQGGRLHIDPSLIRVMEHGPDLSATAELVRTTLQLYEVSEVQKAYHKDVAARLESVLTAPVAIQPIDRAVLTEAALLGPLSVGSDLRLVQMDEYQVLALKGEPGGRSLLHPFPATLLNKYWHKDTGVQRLTEYRDSGRGDAKAVVALPYYRNVGLLAVSVDLKAGDNLFDDWRSLVDLAESKQAKAAGIPFFDCARRPEDYNCLFFEILLSLNKAGKADQPQRGPTRGSDFPRADTVEEGLKLLREWIDDRLFADALTIFHRLCAPGRVRVPAAGDDREGRSGPPQGEPRDRLLGPAPWNSVISRQWSTSLRHWLDQDSERAKGIEIRPLPGRITVSGEWFLGVWAHAAVPEIGWRVLETLTAPEAQLERAWRGIGLPTSARLLADVETHFLPNARTRGLDLADLVTNAKRRSDISMYYLFSQILSQHLLECINSDQPVKVAVTRTKQHLLHDFDQVLKRD